MHQISKHSSSRSVMVPHGAPSSPVLEEVVNYFSTTTRNHLSADYSGGICHSKKPAFPWYGVSILTRGWSPSTAASDSTFGTTVACFPDRWPLGMVQGGACYDGITQPIAWLLAPVPSTNWISCIMFRGRRSLLSVIHISTPKQDPPVSAQILSSHFPP